jgi:putative transposase
MQRKVAHMEYESYHLYNRGVDKRRIFESAADYKRFLMLLYLSNSNETVHLSNLLKTRAGADIFNFRLGKPLVAIGAFCLMPNHFHILATPVVKGGLEKFMSKLQTGYSMYFNMKNDRTGSLFQGPYRSEHAGDDKYLRYLFSYIHLNPAKLKDPHWKEGGTIKRKSLQTFVEEYPYSSYREYLLGQHHLANPTPFPAYLSSKKEIKRHITDWLHIKDSP